MTTPHLQLSYDSIVEKAQSIGLSSREARQIASNWHGRPPLPPMYGIMAWHSLFIETKSPDATPFRIQNQLLSLAKHRRPAEPGNRVTDFSSWVFRLCFPNWRKNPRSLRMGKETEERLLQANRSRRLLRLPEPTPQGKDWRLLFRDPLNKESVFKMSALTVKGQPLYGVPDIVYQNQKTGEIRIVEIKASYKDIPADGWPNLRAQLWCYAHIDQWVDAPKITLVGQVWSPLATKLRRTLIWDKSDPSFDSECQKLFDCYRSRQPQLVTA